MQEKKFETRLSVLRLSSLDFVGTNLKFFSAVLHFYFWLIRCYNQLQLREIFLRCPIQFLIFF